MKVTQEIVSSKIPCILSFKEIQKEEGIYKSIKLNDVRFIVLESPKGKYVIFVSGIIAPALEESWEKDLFIKTDEQVKITFFNP
jgi:hypothetical protein